MMEAAYTTVKWFVFSLNVVCLVLGIGAICVNVLGVEGSMPGTDAHTFFILGILLCSLLCLTVIIGCYGVFSEIFGVNVIYSIFVLSLLIIQYLQVRTFQPRGFYFNTLQRLENAWRLADTQPSLMEFIEMNDNCCGLFGVNDYKYKRLEVPQSCMINSKEIDSSNKNIYFNDMSHNKNDDDNDQSSSDVIKSPYKNGCLDVFWTTYQFSVHRQELFNWALIIAQALTLLYSVVLCILLYKRRHNDRLEYQNRADALRNILQHNHVNSRTQLLPP